MATLTTQDGTRIFYRLRGKGRPPFLFIHGWCSNLTHWDAQTRYFAKQHRVLAVDRRGHGRSDVPAGGYTAKQHAADLAEVARKERMRAAIVVCHAGGGPAALEFARSCPQRVRALVMLDSNVGPKAKFSEPKNLAGTILGGMIDQIRGKNGAAAFRQIYGALFSEHAGRAGRQALAEALETPREVAVAELYGISNDTQATAKQLTQPVLWLSVRGADEATIGKVFRNVQFGQMVGSGHFPHVEVPDQTNAMIERFVTNL